MVIPELAFDFKTIEFLISELKLKENISLIASYKPPNCNINKI